MKPPSPDRYTKQNINAIHQAFEECAERLQSVIGGKVIISWHSKPINNKIDDLIKIVCEVFEMPWQQIIVKNRRRQLTAARQIFCWFAIKKLKAGSLSKIGEVIGGKDHKTVIHSINRADNYLFVRDPEFCKYYDEVLKRFNAFAETTTEKALA